MKYIKIGFFICVIHIFFTQAVNAQNNKIDVAAIVLDAQGNQISGAVITSDKDNASAVANASGQFSITVPENSLLTVKAIGYESKVVAAKSNLKEIVLMLDETGLVQVAFKKVNSADILGGVSKLDVVKLLDNVFYTYSLDNIASYIPGYSGNIWGQGDKLVIVDGIPRDQYNVIPSEIEQITVLKSAAAVALYGSRAAKGVVSIITKRGLNSGNKFNVTLNTGLYVPKRYAEYLGSAEYMTLYNEAYKNDYPAASTTPYATLDIENTASGKNPYRYPNVDFYSSDYLAKSYNRQDVTAEYTGGTDRARFYANIGYYHTTSLLNFGHGKDEGENRFNVRANLDLKISNRITSKINSSITFYDNVSAQGSYWSNVATFRPNIITPLIPISYLNPNDAVSQGYVKNSSFLMDGSYLLGGSSTQQTNPFADVLTRGRIEGTTRKYQFDATLNFDLASVLKGLSFDTQFGVDYNTTYKQNIDDNTYAVYAPTWNSATMPNDTITSLKQYGTDNPTRSRSLYDAYQQQTMFVSGALKYNNTFSKDHNVSAMLLGHMYRLGESEVYHAVGNANMGLQATYNYKHKYYVDYTGNLVHSAKLAPGHRNELSHTVSLGWRISNEDFFPKSNIVNDLKLTASAGVLKTDLSFTGENAGYSWYKSIYSNSAGAYFSWQEGRQLRTTDITRGENLGLALEQRKEFTTGIEASLFDRTLQLNGSYFYNRMDGIPMKLTNIYPGFMQVSGPSSSSFVPYINYNIDQRQGFDLGLNVNKRIHQVDLSIGMVATYYETKAYKRSDVNYTDEYQYRQGKPFDGLWGLKCSGFYTQDEVAAIDGTKEHPNPTFSTVQAGDLKYQDINGDGLIDGRDEVYLGRSGAYGSPLTLGLNITAKWNNFTLFALANSGTGSYGFKSGSYYWVSGTTAKYSAVVRGRWTPETAATATYPRLTTTSGSNNFRNSDFWLYKNDRINLAKIQLSYDVPKRFLAKSFISGLNFYISGNDLLVISKERKLMETNIGSTPQCRYYYLGTKVAF